MNREYILDQINILASDCLSLHLNKDELETIVETFSYGIKAINAKYSQDMREEFNNRFNNLNIKSSSLLRKYELPYERQQKSIKAINNWRSNEKSR